MTAQASNPTLTRPYALAYGVAAGPVVWALHLLLVYALASLGCVTGTVRPGFTGTHLAIEVATLVALALIVPPGWLAFRRWQASRAECQDESPGPQASMETYLTFWGMVSSAYFGLIVLLAGIAPLVLVPCR